MSAVWFCLPSKRSPEDSTLSEWRRLGYKVMVAREESDGPCDADEIYWVDRYLGWARSVNLLIKIAMAKDSDALWFVTGGDDYLPDPAHRPEEIALECSQYFTSTEVREKVYHPDGTFGVMQPTGDRWGEGRCATCEGRGFLLTSVLEVPGITKFESGPICADCHGTGTSALLDRICGSPWIGREFAQRVYGGKGPLFEGYFHNFADEELQCVARKLGVLWQRRDVTQVHRHWSREGKPMPEWASKINNALESDWEQSQALFRSRKAHGFPGHEPLSI